jgi:hypothetical protein
VSCTLLYGQAVLPDPIPRHGDMLMYAAVSGVTVLLLCIVATVAVTMAV